MFDHLNIYDFIVCGSGILIFWFLKFSLDKDLEFDKAKDLTALKPLEIINKLWGYLKKWSFIYLVLKFDNIIAHVLVSFFFLYIGEENISNWLGEINIPLGANRIGSAGTIGFFGSIIAESLKKLIRLIKS